MGRRCRSRLLLAVSLIYMGLTAQRLSLWHAGDIALWADAAAQSQAPRPWINLGNAYAAMARPEDAEAAYRIAIRYSDVHRSENEWVAGGAIARANLSALYLNDPLCAVNAIAYRCMEGSDLIAFAGRRWPESPDIQRAVRASQVWWQ